MSDFFSDGDMLDIYIFETSQNLEQLEMLILETEKSSFYTENDINEIFRIMHTIKGSAAMMGFNNLSNLAHCVEDLFYFLREHKPESVDYSALSDSILDGIDFIKIELKKIKDHSRSDGDVAFLIENIEKFLGQLRNQYPADRVMEKQTSITMQQTSNNKENRITMPGLNLFKATIFFENGCEMENIRAYSITHELEKIADEFYYLPKDIIDNDQSVQTIRNDGFKVYVKTNKSFGEMEDFFKKTVFLKDLEFVQLEDDNELKQFEPLSQINLEEIHLKEMTTGVSSKNDDKDRAEIHSVSQSIISVSVEKLDKLMDLVGEMVMAESMVVQNPELKKMELDDFYKAARHLHKITSELQDIVMSIRMVPLSTTFQKMHRIVRDMSKKLDKEVQLEILGEETEVDKNIIEHISDPLMHLVRNAIDHGIEETAEREAVGKSKYGKVTLEAKNAGSDVLVLVKDDGHGLSKEKILKRAKDNELLIKPEQEMTDKEIYNLIFLPGFSTKENITEFSGRGVGMDVVTKNIETVGGFISIDSTEGEGSIITMKIPLTLAIIDGMNIKVGHSCYTIPTITIKESFKPKQSDLIQDPDGNEMIMVRGNCYPIFRLHQYFNVKTEITDFTNGILIMVEQNEKTFCVFADELLGQQQVVVKTLPKYIKNKQRMEGLAGCTLLGNGSISLILDVGKLADVRSPG
ncbi:MAG: chemotaxis protein CheA [Clostridiales bacterium]|nr:chemotaxis protein CheA [Clostridiales bacterium]